MTRSNTKNFGKQAGKSSKSQHQQKQRHRSELKATGNMAKTIKEKHRSSKKGHLHITLDKVKRSNSRMSKSTAKNTTNSTSTIESRRVHLDLFPRLTRRRDHKSAAALLPHSRR